MNIEVSTTNRRREIFYDTILLDVGFYRLYHFAHCRTHLSVLSGEIQDLMHVFAVGVRVFATRSGTVLID